MKRSLNSKFYKIVMFIFINFLAYSETETIR